EICALKQPLIVNHCVIVHAEAAAYDRAAFAGDVPGEADARRDVIFVGWRRLHSLAEERSNKRRASQIMIPEVRIIPVSKPKVEIQIGLYLPIVCAVKLESVIDCS